MPRLNKIINRFYHEKAIPLSYKRKMEIILYVMIGLVTKYHKNHRSEVVISTKTESNKLINVEVSLL